MPRVPPQPKIRAQPRGSHEKGGGVFNAFGKRGGGAYVEYAQFEEMPPPGYGYMMQAAPPRGPPPRSAIAGKRGGKGGAYGPPPQYVAPPMEPMGPPPQHAIDECLGRVHDVIGKAVWEAVQEIMHMETGWSDSEVSKKLTRYLYKSFANPELMKGDLSWNEICKELIKGMFRSYQAACGDTEWFYVIDLASAISAGAMVLLPVLGWSMPPQQVLEAISNEYNLVLDRVSLDKAMWEMVESLFGDDEKSRSKIWNAISKAYDPALRAALADPTPMDEISRVEIFMKTWIDDFTCRAWGGLGDAAESTLTEEFIVDMFDHLLQPFGEDHPFSAIPRMLTEENGPPPPGWDFLPQVIQSLFTSWGEQAANPRASKKRKKASDEDGEEAADADDEPVVKKPVARKPAQTRVKKEKQAGIGHPDCTSGPDCAGAPEEGLIRHILEDGPGDLYCAVCWNSFKQRSPELEGVPEE